jgi:hypothetical protein
MWNLLAWAATHWKSLSAGFAATSILILRGREIFGICAGVYRKARGVPESPYRVRPDDFGSDLNPRFGFKFAYPKKWDRSDPENSDGSTYIHPTYASVEVRAWGTYPVVWPTIEEGIANTLAPRSGEAIRVIRRADSGKYYIAQVGEQVVRQKVPGVRAVYDLKPDKKWYRVMQLFVQCDGPQVGVRCLAPRHLYRSFEPLFLHVCDSLELIQTRFSVRAPSS